MGELGSTLDDSIRRRVWKIADSYYPEKDWAHGKSHIERVVKMAMEIGRAEGADLVVLELAAILHDILRGKEDSSKIPGFRHDAEGAKEATRILEEMGLPRETTEAVAHCIAAHRKRSGTEPLTLEARCLFDADKLDALGAIGIIRTAFISFESGQEFYKDVGDMERYKRENLRPDGRIVDFALHSSNIEYELSLKAIPDRMYTLIGRRIAKERGDYMGQFYKRMGKELEGQQ
jgi:uncharacterized protein